MATTTDRGSDRILTGTVESYGTEVRYQARIECPGAPAHLQTLWLRIGDLKGAQAGDTVTLRYYSTSRYGLWFVTEVKRLAQPTLPGLAS